MDILINIVGFLVTLGILVTVHEYGHFWAARKMGVRVIRFSVGFGKPLKTWRDKHGTEFAIASIPLGGYVKMAGEVPVNRQTPTSSQEGEGEASYEKTASSDSDGFADKSVRARIFIASAGPLANFIFAIFAYWILNMSGIGGVVPKVGEVVSGSSAEIAGLPVGHIIAQVDGQEVLTWRHTSWALFDRLGETGKLTLITKEGANVEIPLQDWLKNEDEPNPLRSLGIRPYYPSIPPVVGQIQPGSAAEIGGLKVGDEIVSIEGSPLEDWMELVGLVQKSPSKVIEVEVLRSGDTVALELMPNTRVTASGDKQGFLGVSPKPVNYPPELLTEMRLGPLDALIEGAENTYTASIRVLDSFKKIIVGELSVKNLSGPITIAKVAGQSAKGGLESFLSFLAFLSVMLGVVNLFPIPMLDGGHILYHLIEGIKGSPLSEKAQSLGFMFGFMVIISIMVLAFYNDFLRLSF